MKPLFLSFLLLGTITSFAQGNKTVKITGKVSDSSDHKPLAFVTVSVKDLNTKLSVKSGFTTDSGTFQLAVPLVAGKPYQLAVSYVGYNAKTITIPLDKPVLDMGSLSLAANGTQLKTVAISTAKPLIKQEIDRLSYDVQSDPQTKGQSALDILRRVPLVTVDGNNNIQLQGSSSFKIFINGKPSSLMDNNAVDVLRSMPADVIVRIEVITTPPAKYDSEGLAGIINIVTTKRATSDGNNGTLGASYNWPYGSTLNVMETAKQGKFGFTGYVGLTRQFSNPYEQDNLRETFGVPPNTFSQRGLTDNSAKSINSSLQLTFEADTLHLFTGAFSYSAGRNSSYYDALSVDYIPGVTTLHSYNLISDVVSNYHSIDGSLNYEIGFKHKKGRLLTFSYRYLYYPREQSNNVATQNRFNYSQPDNNQLNYVSLKEQTMQVDYVHPVKKLTIEAGAKAILRDNFSNSEGQVYSSPALGFVNDTSRINNFSYQQDVYGLYNSYVLKLSKWTFQGGVRAEHTRVNADFSSNKTVFNTDYTNVVPVLSAQLKLKNNNSVTFGITNRLQRPGIAQLNPFVDRSNPQIISTGNAFLKPVISHLFEVGYNRLSKGGSLNLKLSYLYTNNNIIAVSRVVADTLTINSFDNAGHTKILRTSVAGNYSLNNNWSLNFNTGVFYVWITGTYNGRFYSNQGPRTNTFANTSYKLTGDWILGASGGYNRRYINLQGSSNDYYYSTFSATKNFKKLVITASVNNPFARYYSFTTYTKTPDFYQSNTLDLIYRNYNVSLSYKFGKLNGDLKKNKHSINNDDTPGS